MLNPAVGASEDVDGRACLVTRRGVAGHALYGPYELRRPGDYAVEFQIERVDDARHERDPLCAVLDVVWNAGRETLARKEILLSQLRDGRAAFTLPFRLEEAHKLEYRVWVSGEAALRIDAHPRVAALADPAADPHAALAGTAFPADDAGDAIPFFQAHRPMLRAMHDQGIGVAIRNGGVVLGVGGVALNARTPDDLTFIGEVFHENAYTFRTGADACVIDIGMNIGLASLLFASRREVREVWSFEPFRTTYDRALANLALNPTLAAKVNAANIGLSDHDHEGSIRVAAQSDSGAMSVVGSQQGEPVHIVLADAATALRPIIDRARAARLDVIVKCDCEGSEFAIFRSLMAAGLLGKITAFMVEWHAMFDDKTQDDLIAPLSDAGFIVFDRSPPTGNGFFYAARVR